MDCSHHRTATRVGWALLLGLALAAPARALTLDQVLDEALQHNPELLEQQSRLGVTASERLKAGQIFPSNPELEGGWTGGAPFGSPGESEWEISLKQEFEIAGQRGARLRVVDLEVGLVQAEIDAFRLRLRADAREAFFRLLVRQERATAFRELVVVSADLARAARDRFRAGDIGFTEQELILLEHDRLLAEQAAAEGELERAGLELAGLLGRADATDLAAEGALAPGSPGPLLPELLALARKRHPGLRALTLEEQANEARLDLAQRETWPNPSLSVGYIRAHGSIDADDIQGDPAVTSRISGITTAERLLGVRLSLPIPAWDTRSADKARARAVREQLRARRATLERAIPREVAIAYRQAQTSVAGIARYQAILPRYEASLKRLTDAYRLGAVGLEVLLAARDRLIRTRLAYLDLLVSHAEAQAALERAIGLAWPFLETLPPENVVK